MPPKPPPRIKPTPRPIRTPTPLIVPPPATIITPPKLPNTFTPTSRITIVRPTPRQIITKRSIVSGPTVIQPPKTLPNTTPISTPKTILISTSTPYSNTPSLISSNLPNTVSSDIKLQKDDTMTYIIIGAVVVGFLILKNKDI
jgi:hypothetical protein